MANYQPMHESTILENADRITVEISKVGATGDPWFENYVAEHYIARITGGYVVETKTRSCMPNGDQRIVRNSEFGKGSTPDAALDNLRLRRDLIAHTRYAIAATRMSVVRNY